MQEICSTNPVAINLHSRKSGRKILWVIMCVDHCSQRLALSSHQCAAKLLGVRNPKAAYDDLSFQTWKNGLDLELYASGLPDAIHELTGEMVNHARIKALLSEADTVTKHLKELRNVQGCVPPLYSQSSFTLLLADENFSRPGEPRTTLMPLKQGIAKLAINSRLCWTPGRARSIGKSRATASCSNGHPP